MQDSKLLNENLKEKLTAKDLEKLENGGGKPSIIRLFIPLVFAILALLEFKYIKNYDPNIELTNLYPTFLMILGGIYLIFLLVSIKVEKVRDTLNYYWPLYTAIFVIFIVFDLLTLKFNILQMPYFPWLDKVLNSMAADRSYLIESVVSSLKLLFTGYIIGGLLGIVTGILAGYFEKVNYWIDPILKLLGPIPTTTWLPLVMVLAINLFQGAVFIISLGVWFQVTLATITGIRNVDPSFYEAARTLGATNKDLVKRIAIPSASPNIFQGLVSAMSAACNALIVAEMMGVESGLGWYITWKSSWADYTAMYGAIILLAVTFVIVNILIKKLSDRVLVWKNEGAI
ncbi:ABC transporter permease [Anaerococcus marasmi]|uniref:ABC transporter permease n=1 Tax=Anaerococcus marasmi TaxID=2057797 RepID=UPI0019684753|nr:ABC transporter permease subunit [Anaerococcus marasmi]